MAARGYGFYLRVFKYVGTYVRLYLYTENHH